MHPITIKQIHVRLKKIKTKSNSNEPNSTNKIDLFELIELHNLKENHS